jgi:nucleoid DNA-binding protein
MLLFFGSHSGRKMCDPAVTGAAQAEFFPSNDEKVHKTSDLDLAAAQTWPTFRLPRGFPGNFSTHSFRTTRTLNMTKTKKAAPKKAASKKAAPAKAAAKPAAAKPIKEALTKSGLVAHIVDASGVLAKDVRAVLASLEGAVVASIQKKGAGSFTLPGLLKITAVAVPAKPKRKGVNPFTKVEQWFAAKPATTKVKVRPLKKLKDAAS